MASAWGQSWGSFWGNSWGIITSQQEQNSGGYDYPDRRPSKYQIEAEKLRIGIVDAKKELKRVRNKRKDRERKQLETLSYDLHIALLERKIQDLAEQYSLLIAQLYSRGEKIRSAAIYRAAQEFLRESARKEEEDIAFIASFLMFS